MKKASDIVWFVSTSTVIWSIVLISVTWVELHWSVYKSFRISRPNIFVCPVPKIFQVMMKWCRRASHLGRFIILCGITTAELLPERWTLWKIQQTQIDSRPSANSWNMYALRRFSKLLKDKRFTKTELQTGSSTFERWTPRTYESPCELVRQSEAKPKQGNSVISLLWQLRCHCNLNHNKFLSLSHTTLVAISPNLCLWRYSLCSNLEVLTKLLRRNIISVF